MVTVYDISRMGDVRVPPILDIGAKLKKSTLILCLISPLVTD